MRVCSSRSKCFDTHEQGQVQLADGVQSLPMHVSDQEIRIALTDFIAGGTEVFVKVNRTRAGLPFAHVQCLVSLSSFCSCLLMQPLTSTGCKYRETHHGH